MPLVELEESEVQALRNSKRVLDTLGGNSKTRNRLLGLIKEVSPTTAIPEIDAAAPVMEVVTSLSKKVDEFGKKIEAKDAETAKERSDREINTLIDKGREKLRSKGYTEEGIEQVEKLMRDRGLMDYEAAAALFEQAQPNDEPVIPTDYNRGWDFANPSENDEDHKLLLKDPVAFSRKETQKFLRELRGANGRR